MLAFTPGTNICGERERGRVSRLAGRTKPWSLPLLCFCVSSPVLHTSTPCFSAAHVSVCVSCDALASLYW